MLVDVYGPEVTIKHNHPACPQLMTKGREA